MTFPKLTRDQMLFNLDSLLNPKGRGYTSQQLDEMLLATCANCADPAGAMDIAVETPSPTTATALLDAMLSLPARATSDLSTSELSHDHPLRDIYLV